MMHAHTALAPRAGTRAWTRNRTRTRTRARANDLLLLPLLLVLAACDAPTIPERDDAYAFALPSPNLVFHWPAGSTVSVWVDESEDATRDAKLQAATSHAMAAWNDAVLFGEYRLAPARSAAEADVLVRWSDDPLPVRSPDPTRCGVQPGRAVTTFCPEFDDGGPEGRLLVFPFAEDDATGRVRFLITISFVEAAGDRVTALVTHEMGHALGIFRHPPPSVGASVMLEQPTDSVPSRADRATIQVLYHTASDLRL